MRYVYKRIGGEESEYYAAERGSILAGGRVALRGGEKRVIAWRGGGMEKFIVTADGKFVGVMAREVAR